MVQAETIYYIAVIILTVLTIGGTLKSAMISRIKSLHRVTKRLESSLDTIDQVQSDINELEGSISENSDKIDAVSKQVEDVRYDLSGVQKAVRATVMFENGDLDKDAIIDDLDDSDGGVHKYFNSNEDE